MKCPHCTISFHEDWQRFRLGYAGGYINWDCDVALCPACDEYVIRLDSPSGKKVVVHPTSSGRDPVPSEVPAHIAGDYAEACQVLHISPKASAALSRRCLQTILHDHGYRGANLAREIDNLLNEQDASKAIPTSLREIVDGVRNFGNFSAHPLTDTTTLQIIDVDPEEAEWCLEIIESMFDHFYVRPAQAAARKVALNAKLLAAGKPPAK